MKSTIITEPKKPTITNKKKRMSSKIISTVNPTVQIRADPNQSPKTQSPHKFSNVSFNPRKRAGSNRARATARVEAFYAPAQTKETLYELLGIAGSESSFSDIKKAYKQMARKYHPDVSPPERVDEYTRRFILVHEAYETLSNPQTRTLYDRHLAVDSNFSFSPGKYREGMEEKVDWQSRWQSQLDELEQRNCRGRTSWGARMRNSA